MAIDFTQAFSQAEVKFPIYLHTPQGIKFDSKRRLHCVNIIKELVWVERCSMNLVGSSVRRAVGDGHETDNDRAVYLLHR